VRAQLTLDGYHPKFFFNSTQANLVQALAAWINNTMNYHPGTDAPTSFTVGIDSVGSADGSGWVVVALRVATATRAGATQARTALQAIKDDRGLHASFVYSFRTLQGKNVPPNFDIGVSGVVAGKWSAEPPTPAPVIVPSPAPSGGAGSGPVIGGVLGAVALIAVAAIGSKRRRATAEIAKQLALVAFSGSTLVTIANKLHQMFVDKDDADAGHRAMVKWVDDVKSIVAPLDKLDHASENVAKNVHDLEGLLVKIVEAAEEHKKKSPIEQYATSGKSKDLLKKAQEELKGLVEKLQTSVMVTLLAKQVKLESDVSEMASKLDDVVVQQREQADMFRMLQTKLDDSKQMSSEIISAKAGRALTKVKATIRFSLGSKKQKSGSKGEAAQEMTSVTREGKEEEPQQQYSNANPAYGDDADVL
jgi:hypothetical protein